MKICAALVIAVAINWKISQVFSHGATQNDDHPNKAKINDIVEDGRCRPTLTDKQLISAIKKTGVLNNPSVKLVKLKGSLQNTLRKSKTGTLTILKGRIKRNTDVCEEQGTLQFVQANDHFAYSINSVECVGNPFCLTAKIMMDGGVGEVVYGRCRLRKATISILVSAKCSGTIQKTIEFGCSCKCVKEN